MAQDVAGTRLGRFRLLGTLGAGGMGVVHRAVDETLRREVALKVLPPELADSDNNRQRFVREARAAAALNHPNIATVHEVGEADGQAYIVMELVPGDPLRKMLRGPLALPVALRLFGKLVAAVESAHAMGIAHRDLKPENVIVTPEGEPKVLDFGLAKLTLEASGQALSLGENQSGFETAEGTILGTPGYLAPEQAGGTVSGLPADQFSLGIMLYEMLSGVRPFTGSSPISVIFNTATAQHEPVSRLNPTVPPAVERLIDRCLAKHPDARFRDVTELRRALAPLLAALPVGPIKTARGTELIPAFQPEGILAVSAAVAPSPHNAGDPGVATGAEIAPTAPGPTRAELAPEAPGPTRAELAPAAPGPTHAELAIAPAHATSPPAIFSPGAVSGAATPGGYPQANSSLVSHQHPMPLAGSADVALTRTLGGVPVEQAPHQDLRPAKRRGGWVVAVAIAGVCFAIAVPASYLVASSFAAPDSGSGHVSPVLGNQVIDSYARPTRADAIDRLAEATWLSARADFERAAKSSEAAPRTRAGVPFSEGMIQLNRGKLQTALAEFGKASKLDPKWSLPHVGRATALTRKKQGKLARDAARLALSLEPELWLATVATARAYASDSDYDSAITEYQRARLSAPKSSFVAAELALAYHANNMDSEAKRLADELIRKNPDLVSVRLLLAERALEAGDGKLALSHAERALGVQPTRAAAWLAKGDSLLLLKRNAEAKTALTKAVSLHDNRRSGGANAERLKVVKAALARGRLPPPRTQKAKPKSASGRGPKAGRPAPPSGRSNPSGGRHGNKGKVGDVSNMSNQGNMGN